MGVKLDPTQSHHTRIKLTSKTHQNLKKPPQMLRVLALAASTQAITWSGSNVNVTTSWPTEDQNGGAHTNAPRSAGALVTFDSPVDQIANGPGSCTLTVSNVNVNFAPFFDAHVGASPSQGVYTLSAHGAHQDQGSYSFLVMGDAEPQNGDFAVECQNDAGVTGPVFDSFPQDPEAADATGSFTWEGALGASSVAIDFGVGNAPVNFTMHDPRLTATPNADAVVISGLDAVNFEDVYFSFAYSGAAISAYDMTITTV